MGEVVTMTINEAIEELKDWARIGYGDKPLMITLNDADLCDVDEISPLPNGSALVVR